MIFEVFYCVAGLLPPLTPPRPSPAPPGGSGEPSFEGWVVLGASKGTLGLGRINLALNQNAVVVRLHRSFATSSARAPTLGALFNVGYDPISLK